MRNVTDAVNARANRKYSATQWDTFAYESNVLFTRLDEDDKQLSKRDELMVYLELAAACWTFRQDENLRAALRASPLFIAGNFQLHDESLKLAQKLVALTKKQSGEKRYRLPGVD